MRKKRLLVRWRRIRNWAFPLKTDFDKGDLERRIRNISDEINSLPVKERLKFVKKLEENVIKNMVDDYEKKKVEYEKIYSFLRENNIYI